MAQPYFQGTRQYIGARYVPKFAEPFEWNPNMSYEPLTIVGYLKSSFTSKKQVPAGIAPTDTNYWARTGDYNGQIEEVIQDIAAVTERVDSAETDITKLQTDLTNAENDITDNSADIAATQADVGRLRNDLLVAQGGAKLSKKDVVVWVGDSFSAANPGVATYAQSLAGFRLYNCSKGGSGFYVSGNRFYDNMDMKDSEIGDKNKVTKVVFCGITNDISKKPTYTNYYNAINETITKAKTKWPNATILTAAVGTCFDPTKRANSNDAVDYNNSAMLTCLPALRECTQFYGGVYLYGVEFVVKCHLDWFQDDGVHLTDTGYRSAAGAIVSATMSASAQSSRGAWNGNSSRFDLVNWSGNLHLERYEYTIGLWYSTASITPKGAAFTPIEGSTNRLQLSSVGSFPFYPYWLPVSNFNFQMVADCTFVNGATVVCPLVMTTNKYGDVNIMLLSYDNDQNSWIHVDQLSRIRIQPSMMWLPTLSW